MADFKKYTPSLRQKFAGRGLVIGAVLAVIAIGVGWALSGTVLQAPASLEEATAPAPAATNANQEFIVRARRLKAEPRALEVVARGRTAAIRTVDIKAEVNARVVEIPVQKGARVREGDVLLRLSTDDRQARLDEAKALLRQRELEFNANRQLNEKGFRPDTKVAESAAQLDAARARVKLMEVELARLVIRAPFAGVIETRAVEVGSYVAPGSPLLTLVDEDPFLVIGQVSERDVQHLAKDKPVIVRLAETGAVLEGRVRFIASTADQQTRTFRIEAQVPNPERQLRDGLTAEIRIPYDNAPAHFLTPAVLSLNNQGRLGVRTLEGDDTVRFMPVEIVGETTTGVWVAGLPAEVTVITVGQENVVDGQKVKAVVEGS